MKAICLILLYFLSAIFPNTHGMTELVSINGEKMKEFVLVGKMKAKPDCEERLEDALKALSVGTYTEPGCLLYALHRDVEDSSVFVLVEGWVYTRKLKNR